MKQHTKGLQVRMVSDGSAVLEIMDGIGGWGYTLKDWTAALDSVSKATHITLRINSPGGDVIEALAVRDLLRASGKKFRCEVYGVCASAATLVALACDEVTMSATARWMVHEPTFGLSGSLRDFETMLDTFAKLRADIYGIYAAATGKDVDTLQELMQQDAWFTATEAQEFGWINGVIGSPDATNQEPENTADAPEDEPAPAPDDTEDPDAPMVDSVRPRAAARLMGMLGLKSREQKNADAVAYWQRRAKTAEATAAGLRSATENARAEAAAAQQNVQERINAAVAAQLAALAADGDSLPSPVEKLPARRLLHVAELARTAGPDAAITAAADSLLR